MTNRAEIRSARPSRVPSSIDAGVFVPDAIQPRLVQVDRALRFGLADERVIEVRPVPMRVADLVVRARGDQQLARMVAIVRESFAGTMEQEGEPAFETAGDLRALPLPGAPLRERPDARQIVAIGDLLDQQVGERRGRFADGEPGMTSALDERDAHPATPQRQRGQRPGESGADDGDVDVEILHRSYCVCTLPQSACKYEHVTPSQRETLGILGSRLQSCRVS